MLPVDVLRICSIHVQDDTVKAVSCFFLISLPVSKTDCLQKGGVPAAPSGTATLLRLSPGHRIYPGTSL
ncbi:hypothetical protein EZS27_020602 [termite gut metagenome]|uniref:Uncharacterized protein n=1 Tax=termite gut metagenome TaxID=433724 RepID=A0A5J4R9I1_9ZZZZ